MIGLSYSHGSSSDFVYRELRAKIVNKKFAHGERLTEVSISREMGVSRTPVREALRRLASEGLVRIIPNSGASVAAPCRSEIEGAYALREHLEVLSVRLACANGIDSHMVERFEEVLEEEVSAFLARDLEGCLAANNDFHRFIAHAGKNVVLIEYVENIILRTNVYVLFYDPFVEKRNYSNEEHRVILDTILSGDEEAAVRLMRDHLRHFHAILDEPEDAGEPAGSAGLDFTK